MENQTSGTKATPTRLWTLFHQQALPADSWERAHALAGFTPNAAGWVRFLDRLFLLAGTVLALAGVFFFFAFNWSDLGDFARFGIVQTVIVLVTALALYLGLDDLPGKVALGASAALVGVLLAVVGQAYQTGADSYRLFLIWAVLITAWALAGRWGPIWLLWLVLLNTSLVLYFEQVVGWAGEVRLQLYLVLLNLGALAVWEGLALAGVAYLRHRWIPRLSALAVQGFLTFLMMDYVFGFFLGGEPLLAWTPLLYVLVLSIFLLFYLFVVQDLYMLTLPALSFIVISVTYLVDVANWSGTSIYPSSLTIGIITMLETGLFVFILMRIHRRWEVTA